MSDMWMAPNIPGLGGTSGFISNGGNAGLANAYASQASNNNYFAQQQAALAAANSFNPWANSGGSFGAMPAYYSGLGAAYGRGTGGFNAVGGVTQPVGTPGRPSQIGGGAPPRVSVGSSPFDVGNAGAVPYLSGGGAPFGGGGFSGYSGSPFSRGAPAVPNMSGGGAPFGGGGFNPYTPSSGDSSFADRFGAAPPVNSFLQPGGGGAVGAVNQFSGRGTGVGGGGFSMPSSQPNPFDLAHGAFPSSSGSLADRFGSWGFGAGTPSQHTTEPYTNAQGRTFNPNIPFGFQTPFSVDNPGGALPASRGSALPVMGAGGGAPSDTLTSWDRAIRSPFGAGASAFPYPSAGGQAFPGAGIGSWNPTNQRDFLANIMSGSQGNAGAQDIGRGFNMAGGGGGGSPPAMSPFGALPNSSAFGRAFQMPSAMGGASPTPPALGGGWGQSSVPQTGGVGSSALGGAFAGRSPQSYINSNFGGMQTPEWSPAGITLADRLRGQGAPALSPFMGPNAFRPR